MRQVCPTGGRIVMIDNVSANLKSSCPTGDMNFKLFDARDFVPAHAMGWDSPWIF